MMRHDTDTGPEKPPLLAVDNATNRILADLNAMSSEIVFYESALGRVLASPVRAKMPIPSYNLSAMDGYAVRHNDVLRLPVNLIRCGESAAGHPFTGAMKAGEAVRIFTGAMVPEGADTIILQEDVDAISEEDGIKITVHRSNPTGKYIRHKALDMNQDAIVLDAGQILSARAISLCLAAGHIELDVYKKPRVGILSTGDELVPPGTIPKLGQIISSNAYYLVNFVEMNGGIAVDLGIVRDEVGALARVLALHDDLDLIVTSGGASVGTHDHIAGDLGAGATGNDTKINFWKLAMRPGKPVIFGKINDIPLLGLPGNPVSSAVCAIIFLAPALAHMQGRTHSHIVFQATLDANLPVNDKRQEYLRAKLSYDEAGTTFVTPDQIQDSAMLTVLATADALIVRPPFDPARKTGDKVSVMPIPRLF